MSAKPEPQTTEIDHIRNTLTDVVDGLGQTRGEMHQRFDQQDQKFDQQDQKIDANQQENRKAISELKSGQCRNQRNAPGLTLPPITTPPDKRFHQFSSCLRHW